MSLSLQQITNKRNKIFEFCLRFKGRGGEGRGGEGREGEGREGEGRDDCYTYSRYVQ